MMPRLSRIAPELPVASLVESIEYYEHKLGFRLVTEPNADYAIVERDDVAIHLFRDDAGRSPVGIHVFTHDLVALLQELEERGARVLQKISLKPWGNRDFRVSDNAGNEIKFTEPLMPASPAASFER
jgi:catechol 2,3-dioxygenase-like lactoylglutathione lyase family enzyme